MTNTEDTPKLSCHQQDMYELYRKLALAERELELLKERTKDCYPKEFVIFCMNEIELDSREATFRVLNRDDDEQLIAYTLEELFTYWKDKIK